MAEMVNIIMTARNSQDWLHHGNREVNSHHFNGHAECIISFCMIQGTTPLMYAVKSGDLKTVKELCKYEEFIEYDAKNNVRRGCIFFTFMKKKIV